MSHNVTSDGMAVLSGPLGFRRRSDTDGVFWGIGSSGGQDIYPIWWNGFGRDPDKPAAYHGLFLGKSGYGKTVSMNSLLYREAMRGTQVVFMEPQGHSRLLAEHQPGDDPVLRLYRWSPPAVSCGYNQDEKGFARETIRGLEVPELDFLFRVCRAHLMRTTPETAPAFSSTRRYCSRHCRALEIVRYPI